MGNQYLLNKFEGIGKFMFSNIIEEISILYVVTCFRTSISDNVNENIYNELWQINGNLCI